MKIISYVASLAILVLSFGLFISTKAQQQINITSLTLRHQNDTGFISLESQQLIMQGYGDWLLPISNCFHCLSGTELPTSFDRSSNALVLYGTINSNGTLRPLKFVLKVLGDSRSIRIPFINYPLNRPFQKMVSSTINGTIDIYDDNTGAFLYTANVDLKGNAIVTFTPIFYTDGIRRGVSYRNAVFKYSSSQ